MLSMQVPSFWLSVKKRNKGLAF
uniref:Uncharacterized protein n=1 Tax=Anguilla anguilla TaxID=7936 RepID=A0A0E9S4N4_ANGAN